MKDNLISARTTLYRIYGRTIKSKLDREIISLMERAYANGEAEETDRIHAAFNSDLRLRLWADDRGLKRSLGVPCIRRIMGHRCNHWENKCSVPGADHSSLWLKDGKPFRYVTQPYNFSWQAMCELVDFCKANGLEADVDAWHSWHYPGHTLFIVIKKA